MQLFQWGRQGSIFGLPIGLALIFVAFFNIFSIYELYSLVSINQYFIVYHFLGSLISSTFDLTRIYFLIKMATGVLWGVIVLLNVAIFRRSVFIAYITLGFACLYYCELTAGLSYGIYAFAQNLFVESNPSYRRIHLKSIFAWPTHFWIFLATNVFVDFVIASIVLDMHWSFIKILQHNGSGWERKAYFEIHQSEGQTVATLQAQWDARMGLQNKHDPEAEHAMHQKSVSRKPQSENTPLITEV